MNEFLEFSRSGYSPKQCARGYFTLVAQGQDHALATMGASDLSGGTTHSLADSKGMWVYHMLRRQIGDDLFFATLRGLIDQYGGHDMSLDDVRAAFIKAAPDQDLEHFFAQWLDRTGAPRFDVTWSAPVNDRVEIVFAQQNEGEPFVLDIDVDVIFEDGSTQRERIAVRGLETRAVVSTPAAVADVTLDPDRNVLIWRAAYDAPVEVDGKALAATAPWVDVSVYE